MPPEPPFAAMTSKQKISVGSFKKLRSIKTFDFKAACFNIPAGV